MLANSLHLAIFRQWRRLAYVHPYNMQAPILCSAGEAMHTF